MTLVKSVNSSVRTRKLKVISATFQYSYYHILHFKIKLQIVRFIHFKQHIWRSSGRQSELSAWHHFQNLPSFVFRAGSFSRSYPADGFRWRQSPIMKSLLHTDRMSTELFRLLAVGGLVCDRGLKSSEGPETGTTYMMVQA